MDVKSIIFIPIHCLGYLVLKILCVPQDHNNGDKNISTEYGTNVYALKQEYKKNLVLVFFCIFFVLFFWFFPVEFWIIRGGLCSSKVFCGSEINDIHPHPFYVVSGFKDSVCNSRSRYH